MKLPALPGPLDPASAYRRTSDNAAVVNGDQQADDSKGKNYTSGGSLFIVPGGEDRLGWSVYTLPDLDLVRPVTVNILAGAIQPGGEERLSFWICLSDYSKYRWEIHGPYSDAATLQLNNELLRQRYVSKKQGATLPRFSYAVVTLGNADNSGGVDGDQQPRIQVTSGTSTLRDVTDLGYKPTNAHFTAITSIDKATSGARHTSTAGDVTITWIHIYDPENFPSEAKAYQVARQGPHDLNETDMQNLVIGVKSPGAQPQKYLDKAKAVGGDNDTGVPGPTPGESYRYYLRGRSDAGYSAFATASGLITIALPTVTGVAAGDDLSIDHVTITWDAIAGVKGYQVLRNSTSDASGAQLISGLVLGDASLTFDDTTAQPGVPYFYWVQPVGEGETLDDGDDLDTVAEGAPLSAPDSGIRSVVITVSCTESPAPTGSGTAADPYQLNFAPATYHFQAHDQLGNDLTNAVAWSVNPPISADFDPATPGLMKNIWKFAGAFQSVARLDVVPYSWNGLSECVVANNQT